MRIGTIAYATEQGIGYLAKWFYDEGVVTSVATFPHASRPPHPEWFPDAALSLVSRPFAGPAVDAWLRSVDVVLFFETPFDWEFLGYCRARGVKTAIVGMYECTPEPGNRRHEPDAWVSPSKLDLRYFPGSRLLPVPVPREVRWRRRTRADVFVHNAGNLGLNGRNGTLEILQAWRGLPDPPRLLLRCQDRDGLTRVIARLPGRSLPRGVEVDLRPKSHDELFAEGDVFLSAEKHNGLSLPLQEARAAGMLVVTTDRFPANDWLPAFCTPGDPSSPACLIPVAGYERRRVGRAYNEYDSAVVRPADVAAVVARVRGADVTEYSLSGRGYAYETGWDRLKQDWAGFLRAVVHGGGVS